PGSCWTCSNAFLAKLNPSGGSLLYATYLGGSDNPGSGATGVAVDASGNALLTGLAGSSDFPVVNPIQPCATSGTFVSEFDTTGALAFSTCLGLTNGLFTPVMALDASGNVYVSSTSDRSLPLVNPIDANVPTSALRPFVSEINPAMHKVLFSSFIAGVATSDVIYAVAVDLTGNVYAAGTSQVSTFVEENLNDLFPIFNGLQPRCGTIGPCFVHSAVGCTYGDAIIMKISPSA